MKSISSFILLLFLLATGFAQKNDIEVFEKKEGDKVMVFARNVGKVDYSVTLTFTSKGMDVKPSSKVEAVIPVGFMKEMGNLTPIPGESWEYSYKVNFVQYMGNASVPTDPNSLQKTSSPPTSTAPANADLSKANVVLYSKPGCSRCAYTKKQLASLGIQFEEFSTTSNSPEISNMWAEIRKAGFTGGSITMPVVRADGKYYYNIEDLPSFVAGLKK